MFIIKKIPVKIKKSLRSKDYKKGYRAGFNKARHNAWCPECMHCNSIS